ncbi:hypothetical protein GCM10028778_13560 [Barrientosiimonas marina]|uniref:Spo0E family sporulation regulatory protein-aspartic acid phosphatase n=1 Tax=Lentibacillus kimchii TaxID=1542911 RepID=A0ABW2UTK3_9BACI
MHHTTLAQSREDLLTAIADKRQKLVDTGMTYGLNDERTLRCSRQLDNLLNLKKHSDCQFFVLTG